MKPLSVLLLLAAIPLFPGTGLCVPSRPAVETICDPGGSCHEAWRVGDERGVRWIRPDGVPPSLPGSLPAPGPPRDPVAGTWKVLVIPVAFQDMPANLSPEDLFDLLFALHPAEGRSMADYFHEVSRGVFQLEGTVLDWTTVPGVRADYGRNLPAGGDADPAGLAAAAVLLADPLVDFSAFDNDGDGEVDGLLIVHAGTGEEAGEPDDVWSHSGELDLEADGVRVRHYGMGPELQGGADPGTATIGVYCHEFAHNLGLPDLYDTSFRSAGIGDFGLMGTGAWGIRFSRAGDGPVHPCAWSLVQLGWADVIDLTAGSYLAGAFEVHRTGHNLPAGEFFLVENRPAAGFDAGLPGSGLLIWHLDENAPDNADPMHFLVDLEEADGVQDLELSPLAAGSDADFFYAGHNDEFSDTTRPDSASREGDPTGIRFHAIGRIDSEIPFTFGESEPDPHADAGGPYLLPEGGHIELDGSGSVGSTLAWDLDGDGGFDDAQGERPVLDGSALDGPDLFTIRLRASGAGDLLHEDDALVEVTNQPPEVTSLAIDEPVVAGEPATVSIVASDPCMSDELVYELANDEGAVLRRGDESEFEVAFPAPGVVHLVATVTDDDGGEGRIERDLMVHEPVDHEPTGCSCGQISGRWAGWFLLVLLGFAEAIRRRSSTA